MGGWCSVCYVTLPLLLPVSLPTRGCEMWQLSSCPCVVLAVSTTWSECLVSSALLLVAPTASVCLHAALWPSLEGATKPYHTIVGRQVSLVNSTWVCMVSPLYIVQRISSEY